MDLARHGLAVAHLLDQTKQLRDDGGDATATRNEDDIIKRFNAPLHASIRTVNKSAICVPRTMC